MFHFFCKFSLSACNEFNARFLVWFSLFTFEDDVNKSKASRKKATKCNKVLFWLGFIVYVHFYSILISDEFVEKHCNYGTNACPYALEYFYMFWIQFSQFQWVNTYIFRRFRTTILKWMMPPFIDITYYFFFNRTIAQFLLNQMWKSKYCAINCFWHNMYNSKCPIFLPTYFNYLNTYVWLKFHAMFWELHKFCLKYVIEMEKDKGST